MGESTTFFLKKSFVEATTATEAIKFKCTSIILNKVNGISCMCCEHVAHIKKSDYKIIVVVAGNDEQSRIIVRVDGIGNKANSSRDQSIANSLTKEIRLAVMPEKIWFPWS